MTTGDKPAVIVVSGLPRSGTSMMMRMIASAGVEAMTDGIRGPDEDNPNGYFEFEAVKRTRVDPSWLNQAGGKVVKLVHVLLKDLPAQHRYKVVMMHRDLDEVIASQQKMLARSGKKGAAMPAEALKRVFTSQLRAIDEWIATQPNFSRLDVSYNDVVRDPKGQAVRVAILLGMPERAGDMAAAVEPDLYRNRSAGDKPVRG